MLLSVGESIILRFPKEVAYRVYDEFDLNQIELEKNGDLIVTADMSEDDWLIGYDDGENRNALCKS